MTSPEPGAAAGDGEDSSRRALDVDAPRREYSHVKEHEHMMPDALLWLRAAIQLAERALVDAKCKFFDPVDGEERIDAAELPRLTRELQRLECLDGGALVAEYERCRQVDPEITSSMVRAEREAIAAYLTGGSH